MNKMFLNMIKGYIYQRLMDKVIMPARVEALTIKTPLDLVDWMDEKIKKALGI